MSDIMLLVPFCLWIVLFPFFYGICRFLHIRGVYKLERGLYFLGSFGLMAYTIYSGLHGFLVSLALLCLGLMVVVATYIAFSLYLSFHPFQEEEPAKPEPPAVPMKLEIHEPAACPWRSFLRFK